MKKKRLRPDFRPRIGCGHDTRRAARTRSGRIRNGNASSRALSQPKAGLIRFVHLARGRGGGRCGWASLPGRGVWVSPPTGRCHREGGHRRACSRAAATAGGDSAPDGLADHDRRPALAKRVVERISLAMTRKAGKGRDCGYEKVKEWLAKGQGRRCSDPGQSDGSERGKTKLHGRREGEGTWYWLPDRKRAGNWRLAFGR